MRKLLLLTTALFAGFIANAQCTPDPQYTEAGVYPDSATGFNDACVGELYQQLITNVVPADTTTLVGPVEVTLTFDSVVVTSVVGLPPGFTYSCYDAGNTVSPVDGCAFEGNTIGCILISGTPMASDVGVHNLEITVDAYLEGGTTPTSTQVVDYYSIEVLAAGDCTNSLSEGNASLFSLYPNPASDNIRLSGIGNVAIDGVTVLNAEGKQVKSYSNVNGLSLDMDVSDLKEGIYFVRVEQINGVEVIRFIVE